MRMDDIANVRDWDAYSACCREMEAIERKVQNPAISEAKAEKLIYRYCDLCDRILPKLASRL